MLFILVMNVLGNMISKAANEGLLLPLSRRAFKHRVSMYADYVVLFLRPAAEDIEITMDILNLFGEVLTLLRAPIYVPQVHGSWYFSLRVLPKGLSIRGLEAN